MWRRVLRPRVLMALCAPVLFLADLAVVTFFILTQNWQGVILSLCVLLVGMQAIYWYFRAREICTAPSHQVETILLLLVPLTLTFLTVSADGGSTEGMDAVRHGWSRNGSVEASLQEGISQCGVNSTPASTQALLLHHMNHTPPSPHQPRPHRLQHVHIISNLSIKISKQNAAFHIFMHVYMCGR